VISLMHVHIMALLLYTPSFFRLHISKMPFSYGIAIISSLKLLYPTVHTQFIMRYILNVTYVHTPVCTIRVLYLERTLYLGSILLYNKSIYKLL